MFKTLSGSVRDLIGKSKPPPAPKIFADRYLLENKLSVDLREGGMSIVCSAVDLKGLRSVAIKFPKPEYLNTPVAKETFANETSALSAIRSSNVVSFFDSGIEADHPFVVMELVQAHILHFYSPTFLKSLSSVLELFSDVCDAVQAVHDHGFVHRDIKPANVFVLTDRSVKLFDFGFARRMGDCSPSVVPMGGTTEFLAPERRDPGKPPEPPVDVYSLGGVLYFMLTHRYPLTGSGDFVHLIDRHFKTDVMTEKVYHTTMRALAERPEDRFQTAAEMKAAIRDCITALEKAA